MDPNGIPPVTDPELAELKGEAQDPSLSQDVITLCGRQVQVRLLNWKAERKIIKALAPHVAKLQDIMGANGSVDGLEMLGTVVSELADVVPECVAAAFHRDGITVAMLEDESNAKELITAIKAQIEKNGLADILGKLLPTVARGRNQAKTTVGT